jgi:uncharacterized protein YecE (DUF72 family)
MRAFVGTSGWSYPEWRGSFYPAGFRTDKMLAYYAERFGTVEVNNSFYRIPTEAVLSGWAQQVPNDFRFVMKASRRITHIHRLNDDDESLAYFLRTITSLGARLGPTLFQLPPTLQIDLAKLERFLRQLPRRWPAAIEFRHPSWFVDEVYAMLRAHDVPLVAVDANEGEGVTAPLVPTASWGYLRLRRGEYSSTDLASWADRVEDQPWNQAYLFLKHEEGSPRGPAAAQELKGRLEPGKGDEDHDLVPPGLLL